MTSHAAFDEARVGSLITALVDSVARSYPDAAAGSSIPKGEKLTYFHSSVVQHSSVRSLVRALVRARIALDWATAAMAVSLVMRYRRKKGDTSVTPHMLHRMMIGAMLVAAKAHQDVIPTNRLLAKTVNIVPAELSRMEAAFLHALDWRVNVDRSTIVEDEIELLRPVVGSPDSSPRLALSAAPSPCSVPVSLDAPWQLPVS